MILIGIDPHKSSHTAVAVDPAGHQVGQRRFAVNVGTFRQLLRWLPTVVPAAPTPAELTRAHVVAYTTRTDAAEVTRYRDMRELRLLVGPPAIRDELPADAWSAFRRRIPKPRVAGIGGYTDGEWDRLLAAVRADVAATARRIRAGEDLLRRLAEEPQRLDPQERAQAETLAEIAASGEVPVGPGQDPLVRHRLASQLFLVWSDMVPLLVLLVAVTERNGETIKELPAAHRVLEDRAVELVVTKRRRGAKRWFETVTWEIGPRGRELHTPGGLYLLLLELTARSRTFCGSSSALCLWRAGHIVGVYGTAEHAAPFEGALRTGNLPIARWAATRPKPLLADPAPDPGSDGQKAPPAEPGPLIVTLNRVRTSAEVRRTKRLGGHLPSAAKSNTAQVLYTNYLNYLRPDPAIREWAEEVMGEALVDAEQAARTAHEQAALNVHDERSQARGGGPAIQPDADAAGGDTAWGSCTDHDHHPQTGRHCHESFLACFHCGNCLITRDKLPRLLALLDAMHTRRQKLDEDAWWKIYGPAWAAIRRDVLPKFSPAEVAEVRAHPLPDALLDLVEAPWEYP